MDSNITDNPTGAPLDYEGALAFLFSRLPMFSRVGAAAYKPGLDTSLALDKHFGHPHRRFKTIHVGGTNGKGSTSHMLAAILQSQGYKVGLYTSPHLVDFRERMRIDGKMIPKEDVIDFVNKWQATDYPGHPSFFELTMMMAFDWFAKSRVDIAVIEVGMGGRLDSTNIIAPLACVITNISNDHTQFLGETLTQIASEKAGIIKKDIPVVIGEAEGEIRKVFADAAAKAGAPIVFAQDQTELQEIQSTSAGWHCLTDDFEFDVPLAGDYQQKNIETVLHAVELIRQAGITIDNSSVVNGMENVNSLTGFMGRWTILQQNPLTVADTGHNIAGMTYNMAQLARLMEKRPDAKLRIVLGFVADKAIDKILAVLPRGAEYYVTNASIPRALPAGKLLERMHDAGLDGTVHVPVKAAYDAAKAGAGKDDIIFIGGSTFVVADLFSDI